MEHKSSKQMVLSILGVLILLVAVVGVSFAFFTYTREGQTNNTIHSGTITLDYTESVNGITLSNALPVADDSALSTTDHQGYFDFIVDYVIKGNTSIVYEVNIVDNTESSAAFTSGIKKLDPINLKVALVNIDTDSRVMEPEYFSKLEKVSSTDAKKGLKMISKTVTATGTDNYRLYMWIPIMDANGREISMMDVLSDTDKDVDGNPVVLQSGINNQTFSVKVNVQGMDAVAK